MRPTARSIDHTAWVRDDVVEDRPWSAVEREADPFAELINHQDGVIARWQARRFLTDGAIRHRVASGGWRRAHRGVFLTYNGRLTDTQRWWIAVLAVSPPTGESTVDGYAAWLGGITALQAIGLRGIRSDGVHILGVHTLRTAMPGGATLHRTTHLPNEDKNPWVRPPTTTPARSVVDAAAWARSSDEARLIIAASFQQRLVRAPDIAEVLDRRPAVRRRLLIIETVRDCAGGSHSVGELNITALCRRARLPLPTRQLRRRDAAGRLRYLDACFDDWKLVVEIDGAHHADVGQMWDDCARQNDLLLAGYVVLLYPVYVVRNQPQRVVAEIRAALLAAGWRP